MTTRSRFALVLGLAGLVVAGVQLAMLSDPPTIVQLVVVAFWSVVGVAYLGSALAQHLRARRRPEPAPPVPAPLEEIVPVPVRPARPRPRPVPAGEGEPARVAITGRPRPTPTPAAPAAPTLAPAVRERHPAHDRPAPRPAERAVRAEACVPGVDATTDAFTVRAADVAPPAPERPVLRAVSGDAAVSAAPSPAPSPAPSSAPSSAPSPPLSSTLSSALSFGPARGRTVASGPGREVRRPRPTPPFGQQKVTPPAATPPTSGGRRLSAVPDPLWDPLPVPTPSASPLSGPVPLPDVPGPRARHRADDVPDPVAARRGAPRHGRPTEDR